MKAVVLFSGGMDSTTLLYQVVSDFGRREVTALSFDYGQRHLRELESARTITAVLGVEHKQVRMPYSLFEGSSQTSKDIPVPKGHYEDPTMRLTFVPNRNMSMLSLAAAYAISQEADYVYFAAHAGDHAIYPDCREPFVEAMNKTLAVANYRAISVIAPFLQMSKGAIVRRALSLGVPLDITWSCYEGGVKHCGVCGTCVERILAFQEAGAEDHTAYLITPDTSQAALG